MTDLNLDETHSSTLKSWVESSVYAGDFPLQNLPLGLFRRATGQPRIGTAIGQVVLDLERTVSVGVLGTLDPELHEALIAPTLNRLFALGRPALRSVRHAIHSLLRADSTLPRPPEECLIPLKDVELRYIRQVLERFDNNYTKAAQVLGVNRNTLYNRLKEK